jgi:hypothetical protein
MLPDRRAYLLVLMPVGISAVQLLVRFQTIDSNTAMLADLICVALVSPWLDNFRLRNPLAVLTGVSIAQAILTSGFYEINPLRFVHQCVVYILFPYLLANAYTRYDTSVFVKMGVMAALGLAAMNIVVMPFELMMRGGITNLYQLNFSGRAYELIGIILLATTLTAIDVHRTNGLLGASLLITALVSFSRGAIAVSMAVLAITWWRKFMALFAIRTIVIIVLLAYGISTVLSSTSFESVSTYWIARLNFSIDDSISSNIESFLAGGGREDILSIGLKHIEEWLYLGTGVATVSFYVAEATNGLYSFSGYHNLTITILAERGLFLGSLFLLLLLFIIARLVLIRNWQALVNFGGFLFFSHTTGVEFVLHSSHARNANILFFLFLIFLRLTRMKRPRYVQARV